MDNSYLTKPASILTIAIAGLFISFLLLSYSSYIYTTYIVDNSLAGADIFYTKKLNNDWYSFVSLEAKVLTLFSILLTIFSILYISKGVAYKGFIKYTFLAFAITELPILGLGAEYFEAVVERVDHNFDTISTAGICVADFITPLIVNMILLMTIAFATYLVYLFFNEQQI
ncbi:MAG: hypothetical protein ACN4E2_01755 [Nitrospinota bacterium]